MQGGETDAERTPTRAEKTRKRLLKTAKRLFAERGYAAVGTEQIVAEAGVTRGALYHHFTGKQDLFLAVHEQLEGELSARIGAEIAKAAAIDPLSALRVGAGAFLDACLDPALARIALLDAPSVLGREKWREIEERYGLGLAMAALEAAVAAGRIADRPVRPLAHLLLAAMAEAGLLIAGADDPAAARAEVEDSLLALIDGLAI